MKFFSIKILAIITVMAVLLPACSKKSANPTPQSTGPVLAITSLSATSGPYNTSVTITGTGFSATIADDKVFFHGKEAIVTAATATQLVATVPLGAGTGNVTVSVASGTPVSGPVFTYQLTPFVSTFAGDGTANSVDGTGTAASFNAPQSIAIDGSGNLYVSEYVGCKIRKITPGGVVTTLAGSGQAGSKDGQGSAATFNFPNSLIVDVANNVYVSQNWDSIIRKITPTGLVTTIAGDGLGGYIEGNAMTARFLLPYGFAIDAANNIFIADTGNGYIRKLSTTNIVSTFAGNGVHNTNPAFYNPAGIVFDAEGDLFVTDEYYGTVSKVTPDGNVALFAGSKNSGIFYFPQGITIDAEGNLYVADGGNNVIKKITVNGVISKFVGDGKPGAIDGIGNVATLHYPTGIVVNKNTGDFYVADYNNNLIRKITLQ